MNDYRELIHGGDLVTCGELFPNRDFLDFSANINPLGQPESVRRALDGCAQACERYPDSLCRSLTAAIARYEGVFERQILCGNGASDLIYRIAFGLRPKTALVLAPTFTEYERALSAAGCVVKRHRLREEHGFLPGESLLDDISDVDIVFLCNPNNPTGALIENALLERVFTLCERRGIVLVIDECFLDFAEDGESRSLKKYLPEARNLIILRAFTKMFAVPGARIGYALISDADMRERLSQAGAPWSVSVPAQLCGIAAAGERDFVNRTRVFIKEQRESLEAGLRLLGLRVYPSSANYILFYTPKTGLALSLLERGIAIRDCANFHGLKPGFFRTAVRTREENNALLSAIAGVLREA